MASGSAYEQHLVRIAEFRSIQTSQLSSKLSAALIVLGQGNGKKSVIHATARSEQLARGAMEMAPQVWVDATFAMVGVGIPV